MALVKCPDCEKMISPRVQMCPFCGCPAEFFEIEKTPNEAEKKTESQAIAPRKNTKTSIDKKDDIVFWFGGQKFAYSKAKQEFMRSIAYYLVMGEFFKYMVELAYDEYKNIDDVLANLPDKIDDIIQEYIWDFTSVFLYRMGDSISVQQFLRKYMDKYNMQYEPYYSTIVEKYANIRHEEAELARYRSAVKNSRGRWVGGGFGVKGAVKGAVTAGVLNCGADFIHSFGDASRERKDSLEIQQKLKGLYNDPETKGRLAGGVRACTLNIMQALQDEMIEIGAIPSKYIIDREKAVVHYNNTLKWESSKTKKYNNIAQCINLYPVDVNFYKALEPAIMSHEENDISRFIEFWGFNVYFDMIDGTEDKKESKQALNWELADTLMKYYKRFEVYQPAEVVRKEKKAALKYRDENKQAEDIELADNFRRRFGPLIINVSDRTCLFTVPLYALQPEARPDKLKTADNADQFLFWDNGEFVVTDYTIVLGDEIIELRQINEVWYNADKNGIYLQVELKNKQGNIRKECKQQTTIEVVTLLDIALEPYREIDYISNFSGEIKDLYRKLQNDGIIDKIDSDEDKKRKKKIENWYKNHKKAEVKQYISENRTEEEIEFTESIQRRFQRLLSIKGLKQDNVINKYVYEFEAESKELPYLNGTISDYKPDEFIIYADVNLQITNYELHVNNNDPRMIRHFRYGWDEINEIYYPYLDTDTIAVSLKIASKFRKKINEEEEHIFVTWDKNSREEIVHFINIVLEPYREPNYIPKAQNGYFCPTFLSIIQKYEKVERGSFRNFISCEIDNELDKKRLELIKIAANGRIKEKKELANVFRENHKNPIEDSFSRLFINLFNKIYEANITDITYFDMFRNHYEYEIYEYVYTNIQQRIDHIFDRGYRILWADVDGMLILTERYIYIAGQGISLHEAKEFLVGTTVEAHEATANEDWVNRNERCLVRFMNGSVKCIKFLYNPKAPKNLWYVINYTLKALHNDFSEYLFLRKTIPFCEKCGSLKIKVSEGFLGKKYCCVSCDNKSKKKIIIYENFEDEGQYQDIIRDYDPDATFSINTAGVSEEKEKSIICSNCGKELNINTKFCNYCGQLVSQSAEERKMVSCVHCGKKILRTSKFCNFCGESVLMKSAILERAEEISQTETLDFILGDVGEYWNVVFSEYGIVCTLDDGTDTNVHEMDSIVSIIEEPDCLDDSIMDNVRYIYGYGESVFIIEISEKDSYYIYFGFETDEQKYDAIRYLKTRTSR